MGWARLNWTKVGLKVHIRWIYIPALYGLNWTKVGLKVSEVKCGTCASVQFELD